MPSGAFVLKWLAEQGLDEAFLDGNLRALRAAALLPIGRKGPGKAILHWQADDYAKYIISLAAAGPTSAAATVSALSDLPFSYSVVDTGDHGPVPPEGYTPAPIEGDFVAYLAREIERNRGGVGQPPEGTDRWVETLPAIVFWLDPNRAEITVFNEHGYAVTAVFQAPPRKLKPGENALMAHYTPRPRLWVQRVSRIPYEIIAVCAELLAMNPETTSADQSAGGTPSGGASADVVTATASTITITTNDATNDDATSLPGPVASTRNGQPRLPNAAGTLHTLEAREDGKIHQVSFGKRDGPPLPHRKDYPQHALHFA